MFYAVLLQFIRVLYFSKKTSYDNARKTSVCVYNLVNNHPHAKLKILRFVMKHPIIRQLKPIKLSSVIHDSVVPLLHITDRIFIISGVTFRY